MTNRGGAVAGLLLAAGAGTRLGTPKALQELGDTGLLAHGVRMLREGGCDMIVAVLGAGADRAAPLLDADVTAVVNPDWPDGMGSSLRAGLAEAGILDAAAALVALVDQPFVRPEAVARLITAWRAGADAAVATYAGQARNPVVLDRSVWGDVGAHARGDRGARPWLRANPGRVVEVACDDVGDSADIDTPEDLRAARARWPR